MSQRILVIDDEGGIRSFLRVALEGSGYEVIQAETGRQGIELASLQNPDLILLDIGLPDGSGLDLLRELRQWCRIPAIVLSVQGAEQDKVEALDNGADDYLTKPFGIQELLARMRVALRRRAELSVPEMVSAYESGEVRVDLATRQVWKQGRIVKLTKTEYRMLTLLIQHAGKVLTHRLLLRELWGAEFVGETHYLQVYVSQLRRKLEADPAQPRLILTEPGVGYRIPPEA